MKAELINIRPDARKESNGCNGTLEREEWRPVKGYEGLYEVSSFGRVKRIEYTTTYSNGSVRTLPEMTIKLSTTELGYQRVGLWCNRKCKIFFVHRLVAEAFIPNPDNLPIINHRNEKPDCNYPDNLEWCTVAYNNTYGTRIERLKNTLTGVKHSDQRKEANSIGQKRYYEQNPEARERVSKQFKAYFEAHPETKEIISRKAKERLSSPEARQKLSERAKMYFSNPEARQKAMELKRYKMIAIVQLDMSGNYIREWESARQAARELGMQQGGIRHCCVGKYKQSGGYIWKYKSDYENELNQ